MRETKQQLFEMTEAEWRSRGTDLFGSDLMNWKFICPSCGHVAPVSEWRDVGAPANTVAFSCVGRWMESPKEAFNGDGGPCNYAGGGLIGLNPVAVTLPDGRITRHFAFAEEAAHG